MHHNLIEQLCLPKNPPLGYKSMGLKQRINRLYTGAYVLQKLIKTELSHKRYIPLSTAIPLWLKGFFSKSYILYNLKENNINDYLSDIQENILSKWIFRINSTWMINLFSQNCLSPFVQVPEDIGIVVRGKLCSISPAEKYLTVEHLYKLLQREKNLILKPIDGASGDGIIRLESSHWDILWNKDKITPHQLAETNPSAEQLPNFQIHHSGRLFNCAFCQNSEHSTHPHHDSSGYRKSFYGRCCSSDRY